MTTNMAENAQLDVRAAHEGSSNQALAPRTLQCRYSDLHWRLTLYNRTFFKYAQDYCSGFSPSQAEHIEFVSRLRSYRAYCANKTIYPGGSEILGTGLYRLNGLTWLQTKFFLLGVSEREAGEMQVFLDFFEPAYQSVLNWVRCFQYRHQNYMTIMRLLVYWPLLFGLVRQGGIVVHGSLLRRPDGSGVILFGYNGAGKSTLALCLTTLGWKLLADNYVHIDSSGNAHAVPEPVRLSAESLKLAGKLGAPLPLAMKNRQLFGKSMFQPIAPAAPVPLAQSVFVKRGSVSTTTSASAAAMIEAVFMMQSCVQETPESHPFKILFGAGPLILNGWGELSRVLGGCRNHFVTVGNGLDGVARIVEHFGSGPLA